MVRNVTAVLAITLGLTGATEHNRFEAASENQNAPSGKIALALDVSSAPPEISHIDAELTRHGSDTLSARLLIQQGLASCRISNVPIGRWNITVRAYDSAGTILLIGTEHVDVTSGQTSKVDMFLQYATGNVSLTVDWPTGKSQNALHLDGLDDFATTISSAPFLTLDTACTIEAWVRPSSNYYNTVLSKGSVSYFVQLLGNNALSFIAKGLTIDFAGANEYWGRIVIPCRPLAGRWTHVAVSFSSANGLRFYLDGDLLHTATAVGNLEAGEGEFRIGARDDSQYPEYFSGDIDEVRIWNVARTSDEIRTMMHRELDGLEPGLVGYWKFNEELGSKTVEDSSPMGNPLLLVGNPTFVKSGAF